MDKTGWIVGSTLLMLLGSSALYVFWYAAPAPSPDALASGRERGTTLRARDCFGLALDQAARCGERSIFERRSCVADAGGFGRECVLHSRRRYEWCEGLRAERPTASATMLCALSTAPRESCQAVAELAVGGCIDLPDVSSCEKEHNRERCVANLAVTANDPRVCEALERDHEAATCLNFASVELGPRGCDLIDDSDRAKQCFSKAGQHADSVPDCLRISFPEQAAECITALSSKTKDPSLCSKHPAPLHQAKCYEAVARREKDSRHCASIPLVHLRDQCFSSFRQCSKIEGLAMKRQCEIDLARGTVELCATATKQLDKAAECVRRGIEFISKSRAITLEECGSLKGFLRDVCTSEVAVRQKSPTGCDGLTREFDRADCMSRVAAAGGDSKMCWSLAPRFRSHCLNMLTSNDDPALCVYASNEAQVNACRRAAENVRSR